MKIQRITIIGLGQIGGSLVLALRHTGLPLHITGVEKRKERVRLLKKHLDQTRTNPNKLPEADLVVLCLHHRSLLNYLESASKKSLVLDVCSAKQTVMRVAKRRKLRFIGGHPMAGNERPGEKGWDRDLFQDAPFFLCRSPFVAKSDWTSVKNLISRIGALPIEIDPAAHDRYMAMTSHFPAFLSILLKQTCAGVPDVLKGPGYRSMTRLSGTPPELLQTFLGTNRKNILNVARKFHRRLGQWIHHKATKDTKK